MANVGDVLLIGISTETPPSGWTNAGDFLYRIVDGTEPDSVEIDGDIYFTEMLPYATPSDDPFTGGDLVWPDPAHR